MLPRMPPSLPKSRPPRSLPTSRLPRLPSRSPRAPEPTPLSKPSIVPFRLPTRLPRSMLPATPPTRSWIIFAAPAKSKLPIIPWRVFSALPPIFARSGIIFVRPPMIADGSNGKPGIAAVSSKPAAIASPIVAPSAIAAEIPFIMYGAASPNSGAAAIIPGIRSPAAPAKPVDNAAAATDTWLTPDVNDNSASGPVIAASTLSTVSLVLNRDTKVLTDSPVVLSVAMTITPEVAASSVTTGIVVWEILSVTSNVVAPISPLAAAASALLGSVVADAIAPPDRDVRTTVAIVTLSARLLNFLLLIEEAILV